MERKEKRREPTEKREIWFIVVTVADQQTGRAILYFRLLIPLTLLMGDSRVSLFGANYRLFDVGMALGFKAVEAPAPTAPNLRIKHSHPQSDHLGK